MSIWRGTVMKSFCLIVQLAPFRSSGCWKIRCTVQSPVKSVLFHWSGKPGSWIQSPDVPEPAP